MTESLYSRVEKMVGPRLLDVGELGLMACTQIEALPSVVQAHFTTETTRVFRLGLTQGYEGHYQEDRTGLLVDRDKLGTLRSLEDPLVEYFELVYVQGCDEKNLRS